jgi:3-oxoadipate enol-lactonase
MTAPPPIPVLLGSSLGTSSRVWHAAGELLAGSRPVLPVDLPGHGSAAPQRTPCTIGTLAEVVIAAADAVGIERFHYAGISLGGAVGLVLALTYPERLHSISVICSAGQIGAPDAWRVRAAQVRAQGTPVLVDASARRWFAPGSIAADPVAASSLLHDLSDADDESYALLCEALADFDVMDGLPTITVPVLVLAGEHDGVVTPDHARRTALAIPGSVFEVIAGAGHLAPAEKPAAVVAALDAFYRRLA